mmetsp:Transcript_161810/g.519052  ORF Transcript_161810/g.519052 Transcript_161810/m.519052 type:complete len:201 (+) Transcript_161810:168-770(+)
MQLIKKCDSRRFKKQRCEPSAALCNGLGMNKIRGKLWRGHDSLPRRPAAGCHRGDADVVPTGDIGGTNFPSRNKSRKDVASLISCTIFWAGARMSLTATMRMPALMGASGFASLCCLTRPLSLTTATASMPACMASERPISTLSDLVSTTSCVGMDCTSKVKTSTGSLSFLTMPSGPLSPETAKMRSPGRTRCSGEALLL